jgi:diketogulonate reductase-like aldo/keto reductase
MKNAASPGMRFPLMGLAVEGHGWKLNQTMECWHFPQCCTKDHCPSINAVSTYIKEVVSRGGVARIDTGYPYGDNADNATGRTPGECADDDSWVSSRFLQNRAELKSTVTGGHLSCDPKGIGMGIRQSGARREDIFVTVKLGYAGPMGGTKTQSLAVLRHLKLDYADLCLIHLPEVGPGTGSHGEYGPDHCVPGGVWKPGSNDTYNPALCRVTTYRNLVKDFEAGRCKAIGVNNWNVSDLEEIKKAGLPLPSVVQYKFHLHQSTGSKIQQDLVLYTQANGIIFNGFAPLGVPDWVTFIDEGMKPTLFQEPVVLDIAKKYGKKPAQVMLRWVIQQGFATHARTMRLEHMKENLDIFDWSLSVDDMEALTSMPQCKTQRGLPYAKGDPNGGARHDHVISITEHC